MRLIECSCIRLPLRARKRRPSGERTGAKDNERTKARRPSRLPTSEPQFSCAASDVLLGPPRQFRRSVSPRARNSLSPCKTRRDEFAHKRRHHKNFDAFFELSLLGSKKSSQNSCGTLPPWRGIISFWKRAQAGKLLWRSSSVFFCRAEVPTDGGLSCTVLTCSLNRREQ
jgi:hypothetical protein